MKKSSVITVIIAAAVVIAVLVLRYPHRNTVEIRSSDIAIAGLTNGIAAECGKNIDGIYVSIPSRMTADELISVSSDPEVAYLSLDRDSVYDDRVMTAQLIPLSPGIAELSVRSADGSQESMKYTVNIIAADTAETATAAESAADTETETLPAQSQPADGLTVYVTPSGSKYHLRESCAGKNAAPTDLEQAVADGYLPCKSCALDK